MSLIRDPIVAEAWAILSVDGMSDLQREGLFSPSYAALQWKDVGLCHHSAWAGMWMLLTFHVTTDVDGDNALKKVLVRSKVQGTVLCVLG